MIYMEMSHYDFTINTLFKIQIQVVGLLQATIWKFESDWEWALGAGCKWM